MEIKNLAVSFSRYERGLRRTELEAIRGLDLSVGRGEVVAVAGSSGSGKSLLAHALLGLLPSNCEARGEIVFNGERLNAERIEALRGHEIILVPQSVNFLDPLEKVGAQVRQERHTPEDFRRQAELFRHHGLDSRTAGLYPFELSGGMARRVLLTAALMDAPCLDPERTGHHHHHHHHDEEEAPASPWTVSPPHLIVADEPTPGLHLAAAKKAVRHFRDFADVGHGVLLITHDLELALEVADKIAVFYAGSTVEVAAAADFQAIENLRHPYTRALWRALPQNGFQALAGAQPCAGEVPPGCPFGPRCHDFSRECEREMPPARELRGGLVRCHRAA